MIDEIDSIGRKRSGSDSEIERRLKNEFIKQLNEVNENTKEKVIIMAMTSRPWELDIAII